MAYSLLPALAVSNAFSLTIYDQIRENFAVGVPDIIAAKGDLPVGTTTDAVARLAVGPNGAELTPDSSQATGLIWRTRPVARVYNNAAIALSVAATWTALTFNSERYDFDALHSTVTNTGRLTIPSGCNGVYLIGCNVEITATGGRTTGVRLVVNGSIIVAGQTHQSAGTPTQPVAFNLNTLVPLNVGDYVEVQAYCDDTSGSVTVSGQMSPEFFIAWQRP